MKKNIFLFITLISGYTIAMEPETQTKTHLLVIPGQNGMGGQNTDMVLPYFTCDKNNKSYIETPLVKPDFGQNKCQSYVDEVVNRLKGNHFIIHASSQGTATALNYTAKNPQHIKALILESVMLTGNSAIFHTVDNVMMPKQCDLPESSYYTLPYTAKSVYPDYAPTGEQPIDNIDALSTDLPIIILHDDQDFQLNFKDAQALYAYLTDIKKNKHVYLFTYKTENGAHINLLKTYDTEQINAINTILKLHNLLPHDHNQLTIDLKQYQPEVQQEWLNHFASLRNKEQNLECIATSTTVTSGIIGVSALAKWLGFI